MRGTNDKNMRVSIEHKPDLMLGLISSSFVYEKSYERLAASVRVKPRVSC